MKVNYHMNNICSSIFLRVGSFILMLLSIGCIKKEPTIISHTAPTKTPVQQKDVSGKINLHDFDTLTWSEINEDSIIQLDIRYATSNNFTNQVIYDCGRCFLRRPTAQVFHQIVSRLNNRGFGVKLFDCYRPLPAQFKLWEIVPDPMYVADPAEGSMHNRGLALDLTLTDLQGNELDMGTEFDYFGKRAYHDFTDLPLEILERRTILRETMAAFGFTHIRTEWWHYSDTRNKGAVSNYEWSCPN